MRRIRHIVSHDRFGPGFGWLVAASWVSSLADGVLLAAGPLIVASLTNDALLVALAATLQWLPKLLFGLLAGAVSDRVDRARLIAGVNVARAALLGALAVLLAIDHASIGIVLGILFVFGTAEVFADNAFHALIPSVVHRDQLAPANARLMSSVIVGNQLAGPPIGAALFVVGSAFAIGAPAVLITLGALLVLRIVVPAHLPSDPDLAGRPGSVRSDIRAGLAWVRRHAAVRTLAVTIFTFNIAFGAAWSVLVLYAHEHVGLGAVGFGLLTTTSAVGGLLSTACYGAITSRVALGTLMRIGLVVETAIYLALVLVRDPAAVMAIFFVFGAHAFIWSTTSVTIRQRAVPRQLQGRVNSVNMVGVFGGMVIGSLIGGVLAREWGVLAPFWFAFGAAACFVVLLWRPLAHVAHADEDDPVPDVALPIGSREEP